MKRFVTTLSASFAAITLAAAVPVNAQESSMPDEVQAELDAMGKLFGDMFGTAEALTAEQETRLPAAQAVVLQLFPEGTYSKMMDETMKPMFDQMFGAMGLTPTLNLVELTGLNPSALADVDEAQLSEAVNLLDPSAKARNEEIVQVVVALTTDIMVQIEPAYRAGLTRAYATRFTEDELVDLSAYFATPVGKKYAAESFLIFATPQVMSAMNEMMPAMMEGMPAMIADMQAVTAKYPKGRGFSDLSPEEQATLAELLGTTPETLADKEPAPKG